MRYARSGNSHIAWASDMNYIGSKFPHSLEHLGVMPDEKQIELQVFIEVECQRSSIQFKNFQRAIPRTSVFFSGMDRQEGQTLPPRRIDNISARRGDSVHAVKGVGEERHSRPIIHGVPVPVA
jgi:hypothetical protein